MLVSRVSPLTGVETTLDLDITPEQYDRFVRGEGLIQEIFPDLSADQREFILSGYTAEDWNVLFPVED